MLVLLAGAALVPAAGLAAAFTALGADFATDFVETLVAGFATDLD